MPDLIIDDTDLQQAAYFHSMFINAMKKYAEKNKPVTGRKKQIVDEAIRRRSIQRLKKPKHE